MAHNWINTPGTERGDGTFISPAKLDMSFAQPFASPSKDPAQDLRSRMRGLRGAPSTARTPRPRTALVDRRNPTGKQEFTPLLKSAKRNQLLQQSIMEEKENTNTDTLKTPAGLRASFGSKATPGLPVEASMLDEFTGSSGDREATPQAQPVSSSMVDSTPIPQMPTRSNGVLEQGNVLTLRDQEAKLDQISKDNFGLKLKIHYLEEALKKSGTEFQQQTLKENVELRTNKAQLEVDLKKQRKRLSEAEHQLEEYKMWLRDYQEKVKKRHASERDQEEYDRLQKMAEESQKIADEREQELEQMREKLDQAEILQGASDEVRGLREKLEDMEQDIRDRERELDEKDAQLEDLQEKLQEAEQADDPDRTQRLRDDIGELQSDIDERQRLLQEKDDRLAALQKEVKALQEDNANLDSMQQDIEDMDRELRDKDDELDRKDARIAELEAQVNSVYDREKSTKKLRGIYTPSFLFHRGLLKWSEGSTPSSGW